MFSQKAMHLTNLMFSFLVILFPLHCYLDLSPLCESEKWSSENDFIIDSFCKVNFFFFISCFKFSTQTTQELYAGNCLLNGALSRQNSTRKCTDKRCLSLWSRLGFLLMPNSYHFGEIFFPCQPLSSSLLSVFLCADLDLVYKLCNK